MRINPQANMVLTIEPGCYFVDHLINEALADPELNRFIVRERIEEFRGFGGVRIEDDIIITETGLEMMSIVPREVQFSPSSVKIPRLPILSPSI